MTEKKKQYYAFKDMIVWPLVSILLIRTVVYVVTDILKTCGMGVDRLSKRQSLPTIVLDPCFT